MPTAPSSHQLIYIQYLRGIAALMVIFHHVITPKPWLYVPTTNAIGSAGVHIFFVISGFIMYHSASSDSVSNFCIKRLIRIIPLYWCITLLAFKPWSSASFTEPSLTILLKSLFFIPHYNTIHTTQIWPLVIPGWTLNYEMFFYALFALAMLSGRIIPFLAASIVGLWVAGLLVTAQSPAWLTYTNPILFEFLLGVLMAYAYQHGYLRHISKWIIYLGPLMLVLIYSYMATPGMLRTFGICIASGLCVLSAIILERTKTYRSNMLHVIGNASFSIYLTHGFVIRLLDKIFPHIPLQGMPQFILFCGVTCFASICLGYLTYRFIEQPSLYWGRKLLLPPKA